MSRRSTRAGQLRPAPSRTTLAPVLLAYAVALFAPVADAAVGRTPGAFAVTDTGSATYSIPIRVPPGAAGMQPSLAITYDSRAGNGPLGVGWALSGLSVIQRCKRTLAEDSSNDSPGWQAGDRYCIDGKKLRVTSGTSTYGQANSTYQTEVDEFSRITAVGTSTSGRGPDHFIAQGRNGLTYEYGNSAESRDIVSAPSIWFLDKVTDRAGNYMTITYNYNPGGAWILPDSITYTTNDGTGTGGSSLVLFQWSTRPSNDIITASMVPGANGGMRSTLRLTQVEIYESGALIRAYKLTYDNSGPNARSRLDAVQECDGTGNCLYPTQITWQNGQAGFGANQTVANLGSLAGFAIPLDLNGDGRADVVYPSGNYWAYMLANSSGGYSAPVITTTPHNGKYASALAIDYYANGKKELLVPDATGNWSLLQFTGSGFTSTTLKPGGSPMPASTQTWVGDVNGDGYPDLVYLSADSRQLLGRFNSPSGFSSTVSTLYTAPAGTTIYLYTTTMSFNTQATLNQGDFNGDGRTDLLVGFIGTGPKLLLSTGSGFVDSGVVFPDTPSPSIVGTTWRPIDANADGIDDLAFVDSSGVWKVLYGVPAAAGAAAFGAAVPSSIASPASAGGTAVLPVDWDGDGRVDILAALTPAAAPPSGSHWFLVHATGDTESTSQGGTGAFSGSAATDTGILTTQMGTYVVDVNGDGLPDLVYADSSGGWHLLLHNGPSPDLVSTVIDGYGNSVQITYAALTDSTVYTEGSGATYPQQDVLLPLYVVKQFTQSDGTGGVFSITERYTGARTDLSGRGFLGFATRTETDGRTGIASTWTYRQDFPFTGAVATLAVNQSSTGPAISKTTNTWSSVVLDSTANNQRYFAQLTGASTLSYEVGGPKNGQLIGTLSRGYSYDDYGNATTVTSTAVDNDSTSPYVSQSWTTTTTNTPDVDVTNWCLPLLTQTHVVYSASNGSASVTRTRQFTPDTIHCRYNEIVTEPSSAAYKVTEDLGYDGFGNVNSDKVTGVNMVARTTLTNWGPTGRYRMSIIDPSGAQTQYNYDFAFGTVTNLTDPNGVQTSWVYDTFGRKTQENRPDKTSTLWDWPSSVSCEPPFNGCGLLRNVVLVYDRDTSGNTISQSYVEIDALERPYETGRQNLSTGAAANVTVDVRYDSLGRLASQTAPFFWGNTEYWTTYHYDILNRPTEIQRPVSSTNSTLQTTTYAYAGRTTTVTDPQAKANTTITDVNGWFRQTKDAYGYAVTMAYDAAGTETGITDSLGNNLWAGTYSYGVAPFLLTATDKDLGAWAYTHNALGELTAWSDANKHSFSETYDVLSRPLTRVEPDLFTQWTWGASAANHNIGKLQSVCTGTGGSCSSSDYSESETYDSLGRQSQRTIAIPVAQGTFTYTWSYNATTGLLDALTYPVSTSGYALKLKYGYLYGVLQSVTDVSDSPNVTFWTANTMNPRSQITQATFGNGVVIKRSFDAVTGWVGNVQAGKGGGAALQNQSYLFDDVGNLTQRQDNNRGLSENVYYDNVYRFGHSTLNGTINLAVTYDSMGDVLTTQSEGGAVTTRNYTAPQAGCTGNSQLHAVRQTVQGSTTQSFCYDSNGNTTTTKVNGTLFGTSSWTSYNQPSAISGGTSSSSFLYDANHQRWQQTARYAGTTETTDYIGGLMERVVVPSGIAFRHYVPVGNDTVIYTRWSTGSAPTYYVTADHLGSAAVITDSSGNLVLNENFAAPGWRRGDNWTGKPTTAELTTIDSITHRGFTGQEMLDNLSLTDMNGRVYTNLGTFLSPDPFISNPRNTQSYNRYAYVNNNALSYTDPTGFFNFWDLLNPFSNDNPLNPFGRVGREIALAPFDPSIGNDLLRKNPWLQTIGEIAACYWGQAWGCSAASAYLTRLNGGSLLQSAEAGFFAYTLYDGIAPDATSWYGRAFERAVVEGGIVGAMGGDYTRGFEFAFAGSALNDWYTGTVGHNADWSPGENQVAYNVPCGDPGSNCYEALSKGQIPQDWWTKNTWGNNEYLQGNGTLTDCFTQSGPCSRVADQVPGMQALSQLHDTWLNPGGILPHWLNFPSMPFAAGITYGALIGDSIFNFTPWLKITTPGWASSSSWLGVPPATAGYGH